MSAEPNCRLATRKSPLAMKQAEIVADLVRSRLNIQVEVIAMSTTGDRQADWSLQERGGKGLFTKELEKAILDGRADIAVHSAKDMPTEDPAGLKISSFLKREDPRDVLITSKIDGDIERIASGSPRRIRQLQGRFPNIEWLELRGNVETRLRKIAELEEADGTVLAAAGLNRLEISQYPGLNFEVMEFDQMVPAPGQGAIAIQSKISDAEKYSVLGCPDTERAVRLEREVLKRMGGGCQTALGVHLSENLLYFFHEKTGILCQKFDDSLKDHIIDNLVTKTRE
ncbi:MAG: hydroxymethylbilane synthase [Verrucomicrobiota bacterium]|nr:hydroxymethylbilane synthase [Verrucomicrobiota bacterium]